MFFRVGQQELILGSARCFSRKLVVYLKSGSPARVPEVLGCNNRGGTTTTTILVLVGGKEAPGPAFSSHTNTTQKRRPQNKCFGKKKTRPEA